MNKEQLLQGIAEMLSQNLGNRMTNELAGGIYGFIQNKLEALKEESKQDGESTDSK